ncbi:MAG: N-acetyltransferase [Wenzhouxiangellaceae bacterium]|nr:N-acetyltransferase [Wenzhouxiangellaceae bacterium]
MKFSAYDKADESGIRTLFVESFAVSEGPSEGALIGRLVRDLLNETESREVFGFVVTERGKIIGCIFFTRLVYDAPVDVFLLSPVAVHTDYQGKGIGQRLIRFGLDRLRDKGVQCVFTYGDPGFYSKVGFVRVSEEIAQAPFELTHPEGWLGQSLDGSRVKPLSGRPRCMKPFDIPELW